MPPSGDGAGKGSPFAILPPVWHPERIPKPSARTDAGVRAGGIELSASVVRPAALRRPIASDAGRQPGVRLRSRDLHPRNAKRELRPRGCNSVAPATNPRTLAPDPAARFHRRCRRARAGRTCVAQAQFSQAACCARFGLAPAVRRTPVILPPCARTGVRQYGLPERSGAKRKRRCAGTARSCGPRPEHHRLRLLECNRRGPGRPFGLGRHGSWRCAASILPGAVEPCRTQQRSPEMGKDPPHRFHTRWQGGRSPVSGDLRFPERPPANRSLARCTASESAAGRGGMTADGTVFR